MAKKHPIWHHIKTRPRYVKATKKTERTQKTVKQGLEEVVLEILIPGEPRNQTTSLRESGIQFPGTRIIPLRKSGI